MLLSIMGMYEYDQSIFDGLEMPSYTDENNNIDVLDRTATINNILLKCAELELIYPDTSIMKLAIGVWSAAEIDSWNKLYATQKVKYNPIWNVDADIKTTDSGTDSRNKSLTGSDNRDISKQSIGSDNETINLTDAETVNLTDAETVNLTDTRSVKGFNSNTWSEAEKTEKTGTDTITHTGTDSVAHTGTDNHALTHNETIDDDLTRTETITESGSNGNIHTERRTGNIGVTATQDLIQKERDIAVFNTIDYITESFKKRFCLMVY